MKHLFSDLYKWILMWNIGFVLAFFGSFFDCLQDLLIWQIKIFALQKFIRINPTFLQNAASSLMKIKTNIRLLPVEELSNSTTLYLLHIFHRITNLLFNLLSILLKIHNQNCRKRSGKTNSFIIYCLCFCTNQICLSTYTFCTQQNLLIFICIFVWQASYQIIFQLCHHLPITVHTINYERMEKKLAPINNSVSKFITSEWSQQSSY